MVNVIGLGYIGLPTALMLSSSGVDVVGTDYNEKLVACLKNGKITFEEKGIEELFSSALKNGIKFTNEYQVTDTYIISVPTPYDKITKKIDPKYVLDAVLSVLKICPRGATLVIESTISPGTIDKFVRPLVSNNGFVIGKDIHIVHAPERIIPGNMIYELINNNRTIGADSLEIGNRIKNIYSSFCKGEIVVTSIKTAEMTKVVENTFRAVNIAFANELAKICDSDDMDVYEIIKICNMHPRVNILQPGPGVGGHCISVDPWFLVGDYPEISRIISTSMDVNASMPEYVYKKICLIAEKKKIDKNRIGLYGLTYKENVDDIRESPTLQLMDYVKNNTNQVLKTFDPLVTKDIVENQYHDFKKFLNDIDMIVILVKHNHIKENLSSIENKVVFDTCNICDFENVIKL